LDRLRKATENVSVTIADHPAEIQTDYLKNVTDILSRNVTENKFSVHVGRLGLFGLRLQKRVFKSVSRF
jgi:hypothetical protein